MKTVEVPCKICQRPVVITLPELDPDLDAILLRAAAAGMVHDRCAEFVAGKKQSNRLLSVQLERLKTWEGICPPEFRKELNGRQPGCRFNNLDTIMAWNYGEKGVYLWSPSGQCKTRFMFKRLEHEFQAGRSIGAWAHVDLRTHMTTLASGEGNLPKFINALLRLDILFIDDLGKGRQTPAAEEAFFALVDGRARMCRPTMFTANAPLEEAKKSFSQEYQEPLYRRIHDKTIELNWS